MTLAWAITYPTQDGKSVVIPETARRTSDDAIDALKENWRLEYSELKWPELQSKHGYRVERVRIERVEE